MSFILDALKKAEAERQRQTGPTLLEVRVSAPRRRFLLWIIVIGALLGINILLLAVFVLRRPPAINAPPVAASSAALPATSAPATSAPAAPAQTGIASAGPPQPPIAAVGSGAAYPASTQTGTTNAVPVPAAPASYGAVPAAAPQSNPADFAPAVPAGLAGAATTRAAETRQEPPSLTDINGDMPELRLDLHVYAVQPGERYALINMHRVREGDTLPEGPRVLAIDRDGVELSYRGTEFMLRPQ